MKRQVVKKITKKRVKSRTFAEKVSYWKEEFYLESFQDEILKLIFQSKKLSQYDIAEKIRNSVAKLRGRISDMIKTLSDLLEDSMGEAREEFSEENRRLHRQLNEMKNGTENDGKQLKMMKKQNRGLQRSLDFFRKQAFKFQQKANRTNKSILDNLVKFCKEELPDGEYIEVKESKKKDWKSKRKMKIIRAGDKKNVLPHKNNSPKKPSKKTRKKKKKKRKKTKIESPVRSRRYDTSSSDSEDDDIEKESMEFVHNELDNILKNVKQKKKKKEKAKKTVRKSQQQRMRRSSSTSNFRKKLQGGGRGVRSRTMSQTSTSLGRGSKGVGSSRGKGKNSKRKKKPKLEKGRVFLETGEDICRSAKSPNTKRIEKFLSENDDKGGGWEFQPSKVLERELENRNEEMKMKEIEKKKKMKEKIERVRERQKLIRKRTETPETSEEEEEEEEEDRKPFKWKIMSQKKKRSKEETSEEEEEEEEESSSEEEEEEPVKARFPKVEFQVKKKTKTNAETHHLEKEKDEEFSDILKQSSNFDGTGSYTSKTKREDSDDESDFESDDEPDSPIMSLSAIPEVTKRFDRDPNSVAEKAPSVIRNEDSSSSEEEEEEEREKKELSEKEKKMSFVVEELQQRISPSNQRVRSPTTMVRKGGMNPLQMMIARRKKNIALKKNKTSLSVPQISVTQEEEDPPSSGPSTLEIDVETPHESEESEEEELESEEAEPEEEEVEPQEEPKEEEKEEDAFSPQTPPVLRQPVMIKNFPVPQQQPQPSPPSRFSPVRMRASSDSLQNLAMKRQQMQQQQPQQQPRPIVNPLPQVGSLGSRRGIVSPLLQRKPIPMFNTGGGRGFVGMGRPGVVGNPRFNSPPRQFPMGVRPMRVGGGSSPPMMMRMPGRYVPGRGRLMQAPTMYKQTGNVVVGSGTRNGIVSGIANRQRKRSMSISERKLQSERFDNK